jgi:hypothetical protein
MKILLKIIITLIGVAIQIAYLVCISPLFLLSFLIFLTGLLLGEVAGIDIVMLENMAAYLIQFFILPLLAAKYINEMIGD